MQSSHSPVTTPVLVMAIIALAVVLLSVPICGVLIARGGSSHITASPTSGIGVTVKTAK